MTNLRNFGIIFAVSLIVLGVIALFATGYVADTVCAIFEEKGDDDIDLINIEDDDEFEAVSDAFDELLDNAEFDEMFED